MRTRANMVQVSDAIRWDLTLLYHSPGRKDVMGTLATNMKVFAGALDEERAGRRDFVGGRPTEHIDTILKGDDI